MYVTGLMLVYPKIIVFHQEREIWFVLVIISEIIDYL